MKERFLLIGGQSDGDMFSPENKEQFCVKVPIPIDNAIFYTEDKQFTCKEETYNKMNIAGVELFASEDMSKNDVVHTLINHYLKQ